MRKYYDVCSHAIIDHKPETEGAKMIVQRHTKRISRVREKGITTAHRSERVDLSPARGLSLGTGVRLIVVTALLIGLASADTSGLEPDASIKIDEPQLVDKGRNYIKHRNPDGSYTVAIASGATNYYNGKDWDAIDTTIVDRTKTKGKLTISGKAMGDEYRYVMEKAGYHAYFPEMFTEAPISFRTGSHEFSFKTLSVNYRGEGNLINPKNTAANPSGNIITYPAVFTDGMDVDVVYLSVRDFDK